jgi:acyl carrier protein
MRSLTPDEGLSMLGRLLAGGHAQVGVVPLDVRQWVGFHQAAAASRMLSRLLDEQRAGGALPAGDRELRGRLAAAPPTERAALMLGMLRAQVAQVLRIPEDRLEIDAPLGSLGMDSLMGLELRNRIEAALGVRVSATLLWTYPTVAALSEHLAPTPAEPAVEAREGDAIADEVEGLQASELERMIDERFESLP